MAKYYPHKQTIIIASVCILAVGGTAAYAYWQPKPQLTQSVVVEQTKDDISPITGTSTNWQKDFFDVAANTKTLSINSKGGQNASDTPLTLTDKVGRDFFARYIQLKQNNLDSNKQLVQGMLDQTLDNAQVIAAQPKTYTTKDIIVSNNSSLDAVRAYGNAIGDIFGKYGPTQSPANIAYDAFDKNDMSILSKIDPIIAATKKVLTLVQATPVPQALAQNHIDLVNGLSSLITISQALRNLEGDPMQSLVSLGNFDRSQTATLNSLRIIKSYLTTNKITYTQNEPGALFFTIKL